jgi:hypothetical protein
MLWAYYASSVLFLGAEYVQVIREKDDARANDEQELTEVATDDEPYTVNRRSLDLSFNRWTTKLKGRRAA